MLTGMTYPSVKSIAAHFNAPPSPATFTDAAGAANFVTYRENFSFCDTETQRALTAGGAAASAPIHRTIQLLLLVTSKCWLGRKNKKKNTLLAGWSSSCSRPIVEFLSLLLPQNRQHRSRRNCTSSSSSLANNNGGNSGQKLF